MKEYRAVGSLVRSLLRKPINLATMKNHAKSSSSDGPPAKRKHWREGLLDSMEDPESKVKEDDRIVVIKDKYPKARYHFLVLPKEDIHSIKQVEKKHEDLLEHMENIGQEIADEQKDNEFILGYHVVPSMHRLHLHVISTDFDSPCLKNKYHWNSFTTAYFIPSKTAREDLKNHGRIKQMSSKDAEELLKTDLQCHKCSFKPKNLPDLKRHLLTHFPVK